MNIEEIRKNKPDGATHHMTFNYGTWYLRKNGRNWERFVFKKDWHYCKPSLFLRVFKIKPL